MFAIHIYFILPNYSLCIHGNKQVCYLFWFQIAKLETDKSKLRQRINMYEDSAKAMVGADETDEITKSELLEKYSKHALSRSTGHGIGVLVLD